MQTFGFLNIFKKFLALILVAYYSIFSPVVALAVVTQPVSVPISIPIPIPTLIPSPSPIPIPLPRIFVNNYSVKSGENINVSWNVLNAKKDDYIKVLTFLGNKNGSGPISPSNNCNLNNVSGPTAVKIGSCSFTSAVIVDIGTFKLGYYNAAGTLLAQSYPFQVLPASSGSFTASPTNIGIGQSVNLNWAGVTNAHPKDYINYLNNDDYTGTATAHTYWPSNNCAWFTNSSVAKPSGSCSIESPLFSGNYKLVYRSGNVPVGQPAPILAVTNVVDVGQAAQIIVSTDSVVVTLDRANALGGLVYGPGFTIKSNGATGWQIRQSTSGQGFGFYESSGGINPGSTTNIRTYINTNKPNGTYVGLATVSYYKDGIWQDGPSVKYTITLIGAQPDLTIDLKAAVDSSNVGIGTSASLTKKVTLTATVKNIGSASAQPSMTRINTNNSNEYWRLSTNSLAPGASQVLTVTTYKNPGTYYFIAETDADSQVNESKEDNNLFKTSVTVPELKPDLVVENIQVNNAKVGNKINADVTIRNIGNSETGPVLLTTLIKTIQPNGQRLSDCMSQDTVNIAPNQAQTIKVGHINCASYQLSGWHTVEAFADFNSVLSESNENNNRGTTKVNVSRQVRKSDRTNLLDSSLIYRYISR